MYVPGLTRCSSVLHLWVQYPGEVSAGLLGIVLGACVIAYPHDTPLECAFGGVVEAITATYTDGTAQQEDWCVIRTENAEGKLEELRLHYPDFVYQIPE